MRFHALVLTYDLILCHYSAEDTFVSRWRYVREPLKIFSWVVKGMFVSHWRYVLHEEDFQGIKLWIAHKIKRAELLPRRRYQVFLKTLVSRFRRCRVFYALCAILRDSDFRNGQALPPCRGGLKWWGAKVCTWLFSNKLIIHPGWRIDEVRRNIESYLHYFCFSLLLFRCKVTKYFSRIQILTG